MATPFQRRSLTSDPYLFDLACRVPIRPRHNMAVFYSEVEGARLAEQFVRTHPGYTRLDELLRQSPDGLRLLAELGAPVQRQWSLIKNVWWRLSDRLAEAASGDVNCFGPARFTQDRPIEDFRHSMSGAYADTVFEKIELPTLTLNPRVKTIYLNGKPWNI